MKLYIKVGGRENNTMVLKEKNSSEESLADAEQVYMRLLWTRVSYQ